MLYCKSKRKASMCKKAYLLWVVLFVIIFFSQASAEITPPEDDINGNSSIDLQQLSINELLSLQKEKQRILADKGYVQYEELDRGSKGDLLVVFNKGLAPGSLMQVKEAINSKFMAYYDEHGIAPSKIDVIAYVDIPK